MPLGSRLQKYPFGVAQDYEGYCRKGLACPSVTQHWFIFLKCAPP